MLFHLTNRKKDRHTHCGVLEFIAEEGRCYLPYWMMRNLILTEGDIVEVEYVNLPIAKFAKFQPQSVDFLEITNPKAVLENALRSFATLSKGDMISINYNEKDYELSVLETRPGDAVSIIECDMDTDFAAPIGYEEPTNYKPSTSKSKHQMINKIPPNKKEKPLVTGGYRLDGKAPKISIDEAFPDTPKELPPAQNLAQLNNVIITRGIPNYDYEFGMLHLNQIIEKPEVVNTEKEKVENTGQKLKHIGKKKG
jgi:ubiquitin fusion degradation protein 1